MEAQVHNMDLYSTQAEADGPYYHNLGIGLCHMADCTDLFFQTLMDLAQSISTCHNYSWLVDWIIDSKAKIMRLVIDLL